MPKQTMTAAEYVTQLQECATAIAAPIEMYVGQIVKRRICTLPTAYRDGNFRSLGTIVEIVPNMRELTKEVGDTTGPALRLGVIDPDGAYTETLIEAWQYEPVTADKIAALLGQVSH